MLGIKLREGDEEWYLAELLRKLHFNKKDLQGFLFTCKPNSFLKTLKEPQVKLGAAFAFLFPLGLHILQQVVQMDRNMPVSLWCEEAEDDQDQSEAQAQAPSQLRAAWDPTVSGHRVIQRLLHVEERYIPSMLYITLIQRDPERREELAKWALEVRTALMLRFLNFPHSE